MQDVPQPQVCTAGNLGVELDRARERGGAGEEDGAGAALDHRHNHLGALGVRVLEIVRLVGNNDLEDPPVKGLFGEGG